MGHYASEMTGPYEGPTNDEERAEKLGDLQDSWDLGKVLFNQGHKRFRDGYDYTCPQCFASVNYWFLLSHEEWHAKLYEWIDYRARVVSPQTY